MKISRDALSNLLKRYEEGTCTPGEKQLVDSWFAGYEDSLREEQTGEEDMEQFIWQRIRQDIEPVSHRLPVLRLRRVLTGIAASLLIAGAIAFYFVRHQRAQMAGNEVAANMHVETNTTEKVRTIRLEDGTRVELRPGSSLHYPQPFAMESRTVLLSGEAFFEVTKNPGRPFIVYTGEVATKVVGTSFLIRAGVGNREDVEVSVVTGKVIVERKRAAETKATEDNGVVLTPNQKVTYYHTDNHFVTGLVEKPVVLKPRSELVKTNLFRFDETPLIEVLEKLQYGYGVRFELLNEQIRNCPFTADLSDQPLYTKLDIIAASLKAEYEVKGVSIVLSGGSCD